MADAIAGLQLTPEWFARLYDEQARQLRFQATDRSSWETWRAPWRSRLLISPRIRPIGPSLAAHPVAPGEVWPLHALRTPPNKHRQLGLGDALFRLLFEGAVQRGRAGEDAPRRYWRHVANCNEYSPSRRKRAPSVPRAQASASPRMRSLYAALNTRRWARSSISGSGRSSRGAPGDPGRAMEGDGNTTLIPSPPFYTIFPGLRVSPYLDR